MDMHPIDEFSTLPSHGLALNKDNAKDVTARLEDLEVEIDTLHADTEGKELLIFELQDSLAVAESEIAILQIRVVDTESRRAEDHEQIHAEILAAWHGITTKVTKLPKTTDTFTREKENTSDLISKNKQCVDYDHDLGVTNSIGEPLRIGKSTVFEEKEEKRDIVK
ncbi:hypothetical protein Tco_0010344 [Tanacetum coccineum]